MSLIAGIWYRDGASSTVADDLEELSTMLDVADLWRWAAADFGVVGVGSGFSLERPCHVDEQGAASILTGQLLLTGDTGAGDSDELPRMHAQWRRANWDAAARARGVFAAVHWDPTARRLALVSDDLGVRPLYYWSDSQCVVFASCLWILEEFSRIPKVMDLIGVNQQAAFGYPLGERTPYHGIRRNHAAQTVLFSPDSQRSHTRSTPVTQVDPNHAAEAVADAFGAAVRDRLAGSGEARAFLSGGMDSRAIVTSLQTAGASVHTYNFGWNKSQDYAFATAFAQAAGTQHRHRPWVPVGQARASITMAAALAEEGSGSDQKPRVVWSGDGGSVGLGWVYVERRIVELLRAERVQDALEHHLEGHGGDPRRVLAGRLRDAEPLDPVMNLVREYEAGHTGDAVRGMHRFLLRNDQRRHLHEHFETLLSHRVELHLPFFDPRLLAVIEGTPTERLLYHRLYNEWWELLPAVVRSVPWQTYPGHVPCPVPVQQQHEYQWSTKYVPPHQRNAARDRLRQVGEVLFSRDFPSDILSRPRVLAAYAATRSGWRDYGYLLAMAATFGRYWRKTGGRVVGP